MKHLSAKQNLGYPIQVVPFDMLFFNWAPAFNKRGDIDPKWVNTYEIYKNWDKYGGNGGHLCNTKPVDGKYHICVYELKASIEQEGMQYPIPVRMNPSEQRLEFFSGMARIRYATIHNYDSIDAIISEENDILFNLQEIMKSSGVRDRIFTYDKQYTI